MTRKIKLNQEYERFIKTTQPNEMHVSRAALNRECEFFTIFFLGLLFQAIEKCGTKFFLSFLGCNNLGGDTVQITSSLRAQSAATIGILFNQFQLFQILKSFTRHSSGTSTPMAGSTSIITTNSIDFANCRNTDG